MTQYRVGACSTALCKLGIQVMLNSNISVWYLNLNSATPQCMTLFGFAGAVATSLSTRNHQSHGITLVFYLEAPSVAGDKIKQHEGSGVLWAS